MASGIFCIALLPGAFAVTWSGAGSGPEWTLSSNWQAGILPTARDVLTFGVVGGRRSNVNTFGAEISFDAIIVTGTGYSLSGNAVTLISGLYLNPFSATTTQVGFDIKLTWPYAVPFDLSTTQTVALTGGLNLNGRSLRLTSANSTTLSGNIVGTGSTTRLPGPGVVTFSGNNTYTGYTDVDGGTLVVTSNNALGSTGALNSTHVSAGGSLALGAAGLNIPESIALNGWTASGTLRTSAPGVCGAGCTISGPIYLNGDVRIQLDSDQLTLTSGVSEFNGPRALTIAGTGTSALTLATGAAATHTGGTTVDNITYRINGSAGAVTLANGATLTGSGNTSGIAFASAAAATISPGDPVGTLTSNGNVSFATTGTATYGVEIGGPTPGAGGHDQLAVIGGVNLAGATFAVALVNGYVPPIGQQFTIVQSSLPVTGQFVQGASINVGPYAFSITYNPTTVVLARVASTKTWSGAGGNDSWSTAANWVGGFVPLAGDVLLFPPSALRKANNNDLPANTQFDSIQLTGRDYVLGGNAVTLVNGAAVVNEASLAAAGNPNQLNLGIALVNTTAVTVGGANLVLGGAITICAGCTLTITGSFDTSLTGSLNGVGSAAKTGSGRLTITGSSTLQSSLHAVAGTVAIASSAALGTGGAEVSAGATLSLAVDGLTIATPIAIAGTGVAGAGALAAAACTIGCSLSGQVTLSGNAIIAVPSSKLTIVNAIVESGGSRSLTVIGGGALTLNGSNTYTGGTIVNGGVLRVNGIVAGSVSFVGAGGTLGGIGSVGSIAGTISNAPHVIAPGNSSGILTSGTSFLSSQNTTLSVELGGPNAGSGYDRLGVAGTLDLGGAKLTGSLINGYKPAPGSQHTIVIATSSLAGQLSPVSSIVIGGVPFAISYPSNSVVLTAPAQQSTLTVTRAGSGGGTVTDADGNINCVATCSAALLTGTTVTLTASPQGGSVFIGWLGACVGTGPCTVQVNSATAVSATFASAPVGPKILDVDLNGKYEPLSDGLMAMRSLFGLSGTAITGNAMGPSATRSDPTQISAYLADIKPYLDVDGNGVADALTDGLLIVRNLFGITGAGLVQNAIGSGATRATVAAIEAYLATLKP